MTRRCFLALGVPLAQPEPKTVLLLTSGRSWDKKVHGVYTNRETLENQLSFAIKTAPKLTIQGGTTEVLRGIIARGLGLR